MLSGVLTDAEMERVRTGTSARMYYAIGEANRQTRQRQAADTGRRSTIARTCILGIVLGCAAVVAAVWSGWINCARAALLRRVTEARADEQAMMAQLRGVLESPAGRSHLRWLRDAVIAEHPQLAT